MVDPQKLASFLLIIGNVMDACVEKAETKEPPSEKPEPVTIGGKESGERRYHGSPGEF